jgi:DNA polymerase-3 subunit epsilon
MPSRVSKSHLEHLHDRAVAQAQDIIRQPSYIVLDFETTAANPHQARIVQIGAVDSYGVPVFNQLIDPEIPMPAGASAVNGITDETLIGAAYLADILPRIERTLSGEHVIAYNAEYERKVLAAELRRVLGDVPQWFASIQWHCAMLLYADFRGDWNPRFGNCRWHKLTVACEQLGINSDEAHDALADVCMTRDLLLKLAEG